MMENKINVLLVDDEVEIQKIIGNYFSLFDDVHMTFASTYEEARERIETFRPRIVISDVNLPDGNGLDLIVPARQYSPINQVIIITGASDLTKVLTALELGAIDYVCKPLDLELLRMVVFEAVNRYRRWYELIRLELKSR